MIMKLDKAEHAKWLNIMTLKRKHVAPDNNNIKTGLLAAANSGDSLSGE